jgi:hypothetical protein
MLMHTVGQVAKLDFRGLTSRVAYLRTLPRGLVTQFAAKVTFLVACACVGKSQAIHPELLSFLTVARECPSWGSPECPYARAPLRSVWVNLARLLAK